MLCQFTYLSLRLSFGAALGEIFADVAIIGVFPSLLLGLLLLGWRGEKLVRERDW